MAANLFIQKDDLKATSFVVLPGATGSGQVKINTGAGSDIKLAIDTAVSAAAPVTPAQVAFKDINGAILGYLIAP